jgi:ankyrin repeat protein
MRASHLAKERRVLELLAERGASMTAEDKQLRTPLFIACALDRWISCSRDDPTPAAYLRAPRSLGCAQFLCEVLDDEADLNHQDTRGDTPMHAAACNGAMQCLRMLLEVRS